MEFELKHSEWRYVGRYEISGHRGLYSCVVLWTIRSCISTLMSVHHRWPFAFLTSISKMTRWLNR